MSQQQQATTVYVSGLSQDVEESGLMAVFQPFGEIIEVHMPRHQGRGNEQGAAASGSHRGFGFVVFSSADEAESAIDNMHLNEIGRQVVTVTIAKHLRAGQSRNDVSSGGMDSRKPIWADEEWIKQYGDGAAATSTETTDAV